MKIAFICTEKLPVPPILGGAIQIYIKNILPILSEKYDITVFSKDNENLNTYEIKDNVKYVRVSGRTRDEYIHNVIREMKQQEVFDLIHVFNRPKWVLQISNASPTSSISLSLHNEMFLPNKIDRERAIKVIDKVEFIVTVSDFVAKELSSMYENAKNKTTVVYSAVDSNLIKPIWDKDVQRERKELRERLGIGNKKVILNVTRLSPKKGAHIVLAAMEKVMEKNKNVTLLVVGSKWYGDNEKDEYVLKLEKIKENLKGSIIFTGFLPPSEIPKYYNLGDIFICASQWREPLARVHYEAMAAGLPMITTDRGGNGEIIEKYPKANGILLKEYNNPIQMANKINYFLENEEEAKNMGKEGRKLATSFYNFNRVAYQLSYLFEEVKERRNH